MTFTVDGSETVPISGSGRMICNVTGDFGGGTLTVKNASSGGAVYANGTMTAGPGFWFFTSAGQTEVEVELAGSTSPGLEVEISPLES